MKVDDRPQADLEKSIQRLQLSSSSQKHALAVLRYRTRSLLFTAAMMAALGMFDICSGWDSFRSYRLAPEEPDKMRMVYAIEARAAQRGTGTFYRGVLQIVVAHFVLASVLRNSRDRMLLEELIDEAANRAA